MNADRTIYGRYGSRSEHKDPQKHVSLDGFKRALEGALELHGGYPGNKAELAAKTGPPAPWRTPEIIPDLAGRPNIKPADGTRAGCIHCHQANDGEVWSLRSLQKLTDKNLWPFPMPDVLGLSLDPKERATVTAVAPGSPAEKGGFKAGDRIVKLEGQPLLSIADVQWVLHQAKEPSTLRAEIDRGGQKASATLSIASGWRTGDDFSWRVIVWSMRHRLMGLSPLEVVADRDKATYGAAAGQMAFRVKSHPPDYLKEKNPDGKRFQVGDVIVEVDGQRGFVGEDDLLAYLMRKPSKSTAKFVVARGGKPAVVNVSLP